MGCKGRTVAKSKERTSGTLRRHRGLKDRNKTSRARERPWKRAVVLAEAHGRRSPSGGGGACLWGRRRIGQTGRVTSKEGRSVSGGGTRGVTSRKCPELLVRPEASEVCALLAGRAQLLMAPSSSRNASSLRTQNTGTLPFLTPPTLRFSWTGQVPQESQPVSIQNLLRTGTQVPVCDSTQYRTVWFVFFLGISRA